MHTHLLEAKKGLALSHDTLGQGMRWGNTKSTNTHARRDGGCFYTAVESLSDARTIGGLFFTAFHGDGPDITFEELTDAKKYNQKMASQTRPWNKFEGTPRSRLWVEYLMHENSPWKALHPFILEQDLDFINDTGFIFEPKDIPKKLWYNFIMAIRYPWEQPASYSTYLLLLNHGIEPNKACFIANSFYLMQGAKDLAGPWGIQYPLSFLESMTLEAAGRFILAKPGCVSPTAPESPNCDPLWNCPQGKVRDEHKALAEQLSTLSNLMLSDIVVVVDDCVEAQSKVI